MDEYIFFILFLIPLFFTKREYKSMFSFFIYITHPNQKGMEQLVHIKENSITDELIDDFVLLYHENKEEDQDEDNQDMLMIHPECQKFRAYLLNEIQQEIISYFEKMNHHFGEKTLPYEWRNNISSFVVKAKENQPNTPFQTTQKTVEKFRKQETKMFYFLWFLKDHEQPYIFPNGQIVPQKKGSLLIIPCSPFFSFYIDETPASQKCLNISGYIYTNDRIH